jgi:hypothetical protein
MRFDDYGRFSPLSVVTVLQVKKTLFTKTFDSKLKCAIK